MSKKSDTKMVRCKCSRCGQVSRACENAIHSRCSGISPEAISALPDNMKSLKIPSRKGTWIRLSQESKAA